MYIYYFSNFLMVTLICVNGIIIIIIITITSWRIINKELNWILTVI
jgi:hypothetical protein